MFSGKTTELLRRLKRYELANHRCLIVKVITLYTNEFYPLFLYSNYLCYAPLLLMLYCINELLF